MVMRPGRATRASRAHHPLVHTYAREDYGGGHLDQAGSQKYLQREVLIVEVLVVVAVVVTVVLVVWESEKAGTGEDEI